MTSHSAHSFPTSDSSLLYKGLLIHLSKWKGKLSESGLEEKRTVIHTPPESPDLPSVFPPDELGTCPPKALAVCVPICKSFSKILTCAARKQFYSQRSFSFLQQLLRPNVLQICVEYLNNSLKVYACLQQSSK